jgi:glycosyltransferase involved in cell wall biosynthesis
VRQTGYPLVLHVIASLEIGGTERQLVQFIRRSTSPDRHLVAVFDEAGVLSAEIPNPPIALGPIRRSVRSLPANLRTALMLRRVVRERRVALVHAHLGISEVLATVVPRNVPVVASRRGRNVGFEDRRLLKLVEGVGHRRTDLLLCNSRYLADHAREKDLWLPPMDVIYNAVDLERFQPAPPPPSHPPSVVVVANLKRYKGQERFLRAFELVVREIPQAIALLVGDGPARATFARLAFELGIDRNVTFVGQVADPRPYVARSHVAALTSSHEGFPNAILEAMAMGRPVVATSVGGVPELVRHGVDGLLTSLEPQDIATAIVTLLGDEALRTRMGVEARRRAEGFDWDRVVRETETAYQKVLRRGSQGSPPSHRDRHA